MTLMGLLERAAIAVFGGLIAGLITLFLTGIVWVLANTIPGSTLSMGISKILLLQIPVASACLFGACALVAPDWTADTFGSLFQKTYKQLKDAMDEWPH